MSMIPINDVSILAKHLVKHLAGPVTMNFFAQGGASPSPPFHDGMFSRETSELLEEIAALSARIKLQRYDLYRDEDLAKEWGITRIPAIVISGAAKGRVRYFGIPSGYEFASVIEDLVDVSRGTTNLSAETKAELSRLPKDVHIQVFGTPACPNCPPAARLAHKFAIESSRITADVIEVSEFPDLVRRYHVSGVPKIVINETIDFEGAQSQERFMDAVRRAVG